MLGILCDTFISRYDSMFYQATKPCKGQDIEIDNIDECKVAAGLKWSLMFVTRR